MQYILSEEEFKDLKGEKNARNEEFNKKLQVLCTLAAKHVPVQSYIGWNFDTRTNNVNKAWGCILDGSNGYCDYCPSRNICPYDKKKYSP